MMQRYAAMLNQKKTAPAPFVPMPYQHNPKVYSGQAILRGRRDRRAVARERRGLFRCGAFAPARARRPSIQNIRERYSDHAPPGSEYGNAAAFVMAGG